MCSYFYLFLVEEKKNTEKYVLYVSLVLLVFSIYAEERKSQSLNLVDLVPLKHRSI